MTTIYFCSHQEKQYYTESYRHIFSQWYNSGTQFVGKEALYDLSQFLQDGDYENLILDKKFDLREQWMMYMKALIFANGKHREINLEIANKIMLSTSPFAIKQLGRSIKGYSDEIWDQCKYEVVVNGNYLEFSQNNKMKDILMKTGKRELVEASQKDKIWGIGMYESEAKKTPKHLWGTNLLGKAIMETRDNL